MRIDRLTSKLQMALSDAQSIAVGRDHNFIEPVHVLSALVEDSSGSIKPLLAQAGVNVGQLKDEITAQLIRLPQVQNHDGDVHMSNDMGRILNVADKYAQQRGDKYISSEIVVLAMVEDKVFLFCDHAPSMVPRDEHGCWCRCFFGCGWGGCYCGRR